MPIFWRPQLSIGNAIIDRDHQYLICLVNSTELILRHPEDRNDIDMIMDQLQQYAEEHFEREEKMQLKAQYPGYVEHKMEHQQLLSELSGLRSKIKAILKEEQPDPERLSQETDKVTQLLRHWLLDHVIKCDMKMKGHIDHC
jgi:hemerythrin